MPTLPLGPYLPDFPPLNNPGVTLAENVYPNTSRSYAPWRSLVALSTNALDNRCLGVGVGKDLANQSFSFAGDQAKLYRLTSNAFVDVSKAGGYNTAASAIDRFSQIWRFDQFRSLVDLVVATNFDDPVQSWTLGTSTLFADLAATAPRARYLGVIRDHLVLGNTNDSFDGSRPSRLWFGPLGNPADNDWGNTNKQSDFRDLRAGGEIVGIVGGEFGVVLCETAIYQMTYVGSPVIFQLDQYMRDHGCIAPGSIAFDMNRIFYLSQDGFFVTTGAPSEPIGFERVDNTFFNDVDPNFFNRITAAVDPARKLYCVAYAGTGNTGGLPNRMLIYNYELGQWSQVEGELQVLVTVLSTAFSIEQIGALYPTLEDVPGSLDDPIWAGGNLIFGAFLSDNSLGSFTGPNMEATIDTTEANIFPDRRAKRVKARPLLDGTASVALCHRDSLGAPKVFSDFLTTNSRTGLASFGNDAGRYHTGRIRIGSGVNWSEVYGIDVEATDAGKV